MEDPNSRRRQHERQVQQGASPRFGLQEQSQQSQQPQQNRSLGGNPDRYRPSVLGHAPSTPRGMGNNSYGNYYQEQSAGFSTPNMPASTMGYGADYSQDSRQSSQGFGNYNAANMMYSVPQTGTPASVYDTQQFGQRSHSSMQLMTPDVTSSYFNPETGSAPPSVMQPSAQSGAATSNVFQHTTPAMGYGSNMSATSGMQQTPGSGSASAADENDNTEGALEEKWVNYQRQLGSIFQDISRGSLESASETLLSISKWLLPQVVDLGLSLDDASLHSDRIKLWNDFNHAWLALGHRQRELMASDSPSSRTADLMSAETLIKMGNELVRLCDGLEPHGLVDYQYGVWEEQIESVFEECLDLFDREAAGGGGNTF